MWSSGPLGAPARPWSSGVSPSSKRLPLHALLDPSNDRLCRMLGEGLDELGQEESADGQGYGPAHYWVVVDLGR